MRSLAEPGAVNNLALSLGLESVESSCCDDKGRAISGIILDNCETVPCKTLALFSLH